MSAVQNTAKGRRATADSLHPAATVDTSLTWLTITRAEWGFVAGVIAFVLILTSLPAVFAYLTAPADKQFMGMVLNVPDHAQYFMWYREHQDAFLINNRLTPEPNAALFFNLLWWTLATVGGVFGANYEVMYQVMRVLGIIVFLLLAYRLCAVFFDDVSRRKAAFLILTFTSGLGWVLVVMKYTITNGELINPLDVFVAEGNTWLSAIGYPHFLAAAVYVWCFELFLRAVQTGRRRYVVYTGLFAHFMGWQHAYDLIIVWGVLGAFVGWVMLRDRAWNWPLVFKLVAVGLLSFPPALYSLALTRLDPLWKEILAQFANADVYTPPPWRLPVLLGFTLIAACAMLWASRRQLFATRDAGLPDHKLMIYAWFVTSFALVYIPADYQIHMLNGWQIPMAILATHWLYEHAAPWLRARWARFSLPQVQRVLIGVFLAMIIPTNVYLLAWRFLDLNRHDYDYFLTKGDVAALNWIADNTDPESRVISSLSTGQYVPMLTGRYAYLAHWAQTADFFTKRDNVNRFFSSATSDDDRRKILAEFDVDYVIFGPAERRLSDVASTMPAWLRPVYSSGEVTVYATR
jgi:hypothetical protein